MHDKIFIDSNIWLYAFMESNSQKYKTASQLILKKNIIVSIQVINEVCFNLKKKADYTENDLQMLLQSIKKRHLIADINFDTVMQSVKIRKKYAISYWDSHIVASAIQNNCTILYTEDMQHNQIIENTLKIVNPFK